jgi:hypothetical protein
LFAESRRNFIEEDDYQEGLQMYIAEESNKKKQNIIENIVEKIVSEGRKYLEACNK